MSNYNTVENTKWFSPLNTQNLRLNASIWRYCGALLHQLLTPRFKIQGWVNIICDIWHNLKTILLEILALVIFFIILATLPVSIPLVAIWRRHLARFYAKSEPERKKKFINKMIGRKENYE